jgi:Tol biopolymer transport system component
MHRTMASRLGKSVAVLAATVATLGSVVSAAPASAQVPGANGRIAFARFVPALGDDATFTANPDGSNVRRLFPGASQAPHWSPDGRLVEISACADPPICDTAAIIVNPRTGSFRVLRQPQPKRLFTPCTIWTPDGRRLACEAQGQADPTLNGIYTMRVSDGRGLTRVTSNPGGDDLPIDYSPDGRRLVFERADPTRPSSPPGANQALFVVNADGTGVHRITPWGYADDDGSWSPNGRLIAFEHNGNLFTVHPDGTDLENVRLETGTAHYAAGDFSWSPDGTRLTFLLVTWNRTNGPVRQGIATARTNGSDVRWVAITSPNFAHQPNWGANA